MISRYLFLFAWCCSFNVVAQSTREQTNFDSDWRFCFGDAGAPEKDFNYRVANIFSKNGKADQSAIDHKFDDSRWRALDLPHDWAVELPFIKSENADVMSHGYKPVGGLYPQTSIGWYRKHFKLSSADSAKRITVRFDGVFRNSEVWINGFYLGRHESGYTGFTYDLTNYVSTVNDNVLVVRVDASQYEGWFYEGAGIYRHVWLNKTNKVYITDNIFVSTRKSRSDVYVHVEIPISNTGLQTINSTLVWEVRSRNGQKLVSSLQHNLNLKPYQTITVKDSILLVKPRLWSIDDPYLHRLVAKVSDGETVINEQSLRFGVREIQISPSNGLLVNGVPTKIKGVNCHQDHAGVGSALPDFLQYYRVKLLKELGANAYRTSHHPATPELLDACDSLGLLVLAETRLLSSSAEYVEQLSSLIVRDRNHPSVFMWSIGNEEGYIQTQDVGRKVATALLQVQLALDPTRTSTYAADLGNVWRGVNQVIPVRGFNYREKFVIPYHADHPTQPVVGTEMGSTVTTRGIYRNDSTKCYLIDQDITAPWWASTAEAWWPTAATNDWYMGGFVWTGFDYRGEPTPFQWPNINSHFGIMDVCGFPKNIYYYYNSWWSNNNVIHVSPHWNWKGREGELIDVWVNSNADIVELLLNGKSLGKKTMPRNGHLKWQVPFIPGKLEARGVSAGKIFSTMVETTNEPFAIKLTPDRKNLAARRGEGVVVNVVVLDKKGREVPTANNSIAFEITGSGKAIGTGNGDPSSHEEDVPNTQVCKRSLFNGKCQIIIAGQTLPGKIVIRATSPNLVDSQTEILVGN